MKFYTPQEFMTRNDLKKPQLFNLRWLDMSRLAKLRERFAPVNCLPAYTDSVYVTSQLRCRMASSHRAHQKSFFL